MMHTSRLTSTVAAIAVAAALLAPSAASAQGATQMPLAKAIVSDQVAQTTLFKYQLSSTLARQIVNACIEFGRTQKDGPRGYAIFVSSGSTTSPASRPPWRTSACSRCRRC
jgi:hypothetical protein